eukprot:TRINITY_DN58202_c0_g1_i1.p1 TRINITY_DN58202_c0_g1~~TRINITY_DN58202_c0_g1_i1.p1  ORF type:complete len:768 (-),score=58.73 TRINITY_DN58202_c0_g1_i1:36-2225(-)
MSRLVQRISRFDHLSLRAFPSLVPASAADPLFTLLTHCDASRHFTFLPHLKNLWRLHPPALTSPKADDFLDPAAPDLGERFSVLANPTYVSEPFFSCFLSADPFPCVLPYAYRSFISPMPWPTPIAHLAETVGAGVADPTTGHRPHYNGCLVRVFPSGRAHQAFHTLPEGTTSAAVVALGGSREYHWRHTADHFLAVARHSLVRGAPGLSDGLPDPSDARFGLSASFGQKAAFLTYGQIARWQPGASVDYNARLILPHGGVVAMGGTPFPPGTRSAAWPGRCTWRFRTPTVPRHANPTEHVAAAAHVQLVFLELSPDATTALTDVPPPAHYTGPPLLQRDIAQGGSCGRSDLSANFVADTLDEFLDDEPAEMERSTGPTSPSAEGCADGKSSGPPTAVMPLEPVRADSPPGVLGAWVRAAIEDRGHPLGPLLAAEARPMPGPRVSSARHGVAGLTGDATNTDGASATEDVSCEQDGLQAWQRSGVRGGAVDLASALWHTAHDDPWPFVLAAEPEMLARGTGAGPSLSACDPDLAAWDTAEFFGESPRAKSHRDRLSVLIRRPGVTIQRKSRNMSELGGIGSEGLPTEAALGSDMHEELGEITPFKGMSSADPATFAGRPWIFLLKDSSSVDEFADTTPGEGGFDPPHPTAPEDGDSCEMSQQNGSAATKAETVESDRPRPELAALLSSESAMWRGAMRQSSLVAERRQKRRKGKVAAPPHRELSPNNRP